AVAAGLAPWALGSDTGGSIKQPAALCGVVGLRPTYGTVSRYGIVAFASSLDQIGPIAKTVRDCALLYRIVAGRDPCDSTTVELPQPVELPEADGDIRQLYARTRDEGFGDEPKRRIMLGTYALSAGYYEAFYGQAQRVRTLIKQEHDALFERFDLLASPTSPTVAFRLGERTQNPL